MRFMAAVALASASLGGCSVNPQTASATNTPCVPVSNQVAPACPAPTGVNPITALWSTIIPARQSGDRFGWRAARQLSGFTVDDQTFSPQRVALPEGGVLFSGWKAVILTTVMDAIVGPALPRQSP
jgi:hypothetical protein